MSKVLITLVDTKALSDTKQAVNNILTSSSINKELVLEMDSATGDPDISLQIIDFLFSSKVLVKTYSKGTMDTAGTLLSACGNKGDRVAKIGARFRCKDIASYPPNTTINNLVSPDPEILDGFLTVTGKKTKTILDKIISAEILSASEAKQTGIIDHVDSLHSRFGKKSGPKSKSSPSSPTTPTTSTTSQVQSVDNTDSKISTKDELKTTA